MSDLVKLVQAILQDEGKPMNFRDIAKKAMFQDKTLGNDLEACAKKIGGMLSRHISSNENTKEALFQRVKNDNGGFKSGVYALKLRRPKNKTTPEQPVSPPIKPPQVTTAFTGKAGEYGVFSELLYWGYNPAMMVVDYGVDIVATNNGKYFHIQVKTSNENQNGNYTFSIDKKIFEANDNAATFYVFVIRRNIKSDYVILPSSTIREYIEDQVITSTKNISFKITVEKEKFLINNKELKGINDFSKIR